MNSIVIGAISILKNFKLINVRTNSDLIQRMWVFHHIVNKNNKKDQVPIEHLTIYKNAKLDNIFN